MRVAVIGAGIVGASLARQLALGGASVTIIEQRFPGYGTSGTSFAWINSHAKQPESYHRLNVEGCAEHERLAAGSVGAPRWYAPTGNIEWADEPSGQESLEHHVTRLHGLGYPCRWLTLDELRQYEPDVRVPAHVDSVAFFPSEGYVLPALQVEHLLGEAREAGAELRHPVEVTAIEPGANGVDLVLDNGQRSRFDKAVSCAGRWTAELAATCGVRIPLENPQQPGGPAVGLLGYTSSVPCRLSRVLTTPRLNVRPNGSGRLVLQGLNLDSDADPAHPPSPESGASRALIERLGEILPLGQSTAVESARVGQRAVPTDGLTVCGFADEECSLYLVATHSGITLGPLLGRLAATEILHDHRSPLLADFRPERFAEADDTLLG